ncbi:MAG: HD domain-containing protein, partial [Candidatus Eremiobacteraeota bacterium]|nr:HD domain-containing protein [Candidatus Eremiobacteraeota bacterium]
LLASALPPGSLFAVGGRVRDELRSARAGGEYIAKDLDYVVVGIPLADLRDRLEAIGHVDLVGASFSVLKLTHQGQTVDIALPRRDRSTGSGHRDFAIESGPHIPLADDLARRDFRMNMIARALPAGDLVDPYGGVSDIEACRVDILTPKAFVEDPLRMLRAAGFAARFDFAPTRATQQAMSESAALVATVSAERIGEELSKMLVSSAAPSIGLEIMRCTGLLQYIWPELLEGDGVEQNMYHAHDVYRHTLATVDATPPGDLILRLAALLHDVGKPRTKDGPHFYRHELVGADLVKEMLARYRFSTAVIDGVEHLVRQHMYSADPGLSDAAMRRFIRRVGVPHLQRQFALRHADIAGSGLPKRDNSNELFQERVWAEVERKPPFSIKDMHIDGAAVIAAMIRKGLTTPDFRGDERVGQALEHLFEQVTDAPERNEPSTLQALLERYLNACDGVGRA